MIERNDLRSKYEIFICGSFDMLLKPPLDNEQEAFDNFWNLDQLVNFSRQLEGLPEKSSILQNRLQSLSGKLSREGGKIADIWSWFSGLTPGQMALIFRLSESNNPCLEPKIFARVIDILADQETKKTARLIEQAIVDNENLGLNLESSQPGFARIIEESLVKRYKSISALFSKDYYIQIAFKNLGENGLRKIEEDGFEKKLVTCERTATRVAIKIDSFLKEDDYFEISNDDANRLRTLLICGLPDRKIAAIIEKLKSEFPEVQVERVIRTMFKCLQNRFEKEKIIFTPLSDFILEITELSLAEKIKRYEEFFGANLIILFGGYFIEEKPILNCQIDAEKTMAEFLAFLVKKRYFKITSLETKKGNIPVFMPGPGLLNN